MSIETIANWPNSPYQVRPATLADAPALLDLYQRHYGVHSGGFVRTLAYQQLILAHMNPNSDCFLAVDASGTVCGYLYVDYQHLRYAREVAIEDGSATLALLHQHAALLQRTANPPTELYWPTPPHSPLLYDLADRLLVRCETYYNPDADWLARPGHLPTLFQALTPLWRQRWSGARPPWTGVLTIEVGEHTAHLELTSHDLRLIDSPPPGAQTLTLTLQQLTQLVFGYRTAAWVISSNRPRPPPASPGRPGCPIPHRQRVAPWHGPFLIFRFWIADCETNRQSKIRNPKSSIAMLPSPDQKPTYVRRMFSDAAQRYDLMNRLMTLGQDQSWRRLVVAACNLPARGRLLDVATGTGDIALEALRLRPDITVVGTDFTHEMMQVGRAKDASGRLPFVEADAMRLPFPDHSFDAACSGFLMRNVTDITAAFTEQRRVARPGGRVVCLEITPPNDPYLARPLPHLLLSFRPPHHRPVQQQQERLLLPACLHPGLPSSARTEGDHGIGRPAERTLPRVDARDGGAARGRGMIQTILTVDDRHLADVVRNG